MFLRESTRDLKNVRVLSIRGEDVRESFDWVVSRAVAPSEVVELHLGENIALLIGREDATSISGSSEPLPWGNNRVLFHVKHRT